MCLPATYWLVSFVNKRRKSGTQLVYTVLYISNVLAIGSCDMKRNIHIYIGRRKKWKEFSRPLSGKGRSTSVRGKSLLLFSFLSFLFTKRKARYGGIVKQIRWLYCCPCYFIAAERESITFFISFFPALLCRTKMFLFCYIVFVYIFLLSKRILCNLFMNTACARTLNIKKWTNSKFAARSPF